MFEDLNESSHMFDLNGEARPAFLGLGDAASPSQAQSSSTKNEQDYIGRNLESFSQETSSPSSGKTLRLERKVVLDIITAERPIIRVSIVLESDVMINACPSLNNNVWWNESKADRMIRNNCMMPALFSLIYCLFRMVADGCLNVCCCYFAC